MRVIRDENAYRALLDDFVEGRVSAALFIPCFQRLWQRDLGEAVGVDAAIDGRPADAPGLYDRLNSVSSLCATYAQNLPAGCGYRVSEEQFRKEVESMTSGLRLPGLHEA